MPGKLKVKLSRQNYEKHIQFYQLGFENITHFYADLSLAKEPSLQCIKFCHLTLN